MELAEHGKWEEALAKSIPTRYGNLVENWKVDIDIEWLPPSSKPGNKPTSQNEEDGKKEVSEQ